MTAYLIADVDVRDTAAYEAYRSQVPGVIEQYGGRYLVRGGAAQQVEGDRIPNRLVVLEFPDMAALKRFYDSPEYEPVKAMRMQAAHCEVLLVEGI